MRLVATFGRAWALTYVTLAIVVLGGAVLAVGAGLVTYFGPFDGRFVVGALVPYVVVGAFIVARIATYHPFARFGAANGVTLARLILTCLFAGLAVEIVTSHRTLAPHVAWFFLAIAVLALVLDGIDGYFARRQGLVSRFGSRFDMETDALQILFLSIAALALEKAGPWVLIGGLLRYLYVAAGWLWPVLRQPLPPAWRRKVISVIQGSVLAGLMAPIIVPPFSTIVVAIALALLIYSFGQDVVWLRRESSRRAAYPPQPGSS